MSVLRDTALCLGVFLVLSVHMSSAQVLLPGPCPPVSVKTNFIPAQYVGLWYEIEKYFFIFEFGGKCVTAEYTAMSSSMIGVKNRAVSILKGTVSEIEGVASRVSATEAKYLVRFLNVPGQAAPYWVLDTDYNNYAVVYSCNDFAIFHLAYAWILTRARDPPATAMAAAYATLERNRIKKEFLLKTDQTNCPAN